MTSVLTNKDGQKSKRKQINVAAAYTYTTITRQEAVALLGAPRPRVPKQAHPLVSVLSYGLGSLGKVQIRYRRGRTHTRCILNLYLQEVGVNRHSLFLCMSESVRRAVKPSAKSIRSV